MIDSRGNDRPLLSICCAVCACFFFSLNDVIMKAFSSKYPLYELTFFRSLIAISICLILIIPLEGGYQNLKTSRPILHFVRGSCVVLANLAFFAGVAVLPLAEATAIFFVSPVIITFFAATILKEQVGFFRWSALVLGIIGVLLVVKPFGISFRWETLFPLTAALSYSILQIVTRKLGTTDKASTMAFYIQLSFLTYMLLITLVLFKGDFNNSSNPAIQFLTKAWIWPSHSDWFYIIFMGITNFTIGGIYRYQGVYKKG